MIDRKKIESEATGILEKFHESLKKIDIKQKKNKEAVSNFREEGPGLECDPEFRIAFFANAPRHEDDFIISDKKSW